MLLENAKVHLLVFETKEALLEASQIVIDLGLENHIGSHPQRREADWANFWSRRLGCCVWVSKPKDILLMLSDKIQEKNGVRFMQILHEEKAGWIRADEWLGLVSVEKVHAP